MIELFSQGWEIAGETANRRGVRGVFAGHNVNGHVRSPAQINNIAQFSTMPRDGVS
jgi:hypothetical protein